MSSKPIPNSKTKQKIAFYDLHIQWVMLFNTKNKKHALYTRQNKNNMMSDHLMSCLENWCVDENYTR